MGCGYRNAPGYFCTSTHHTLSDGVFTYTYSAAGQLVRAQSVTATLGYTYTADGLRVAQSSNGAGTTFAWDWATPVPELLSSGATRYLLGAETLGQWDGAAWTYVLPDALGSVRQTVDGAGAVTASREWSPYGAEVGGAQAGLGYTGEWQDADVGLVYLRARWYQAETGRFTTEDPWPGYARFPRSQHLYNYAWVDPINLFDPSGRQVHTPVDCELGEICYTGTTGPYNNAFTMPPVYQGLLPDERQAYCDSCRARQQEQLDWMRNQANEKLSPTQGDSLTSIVCGSCFNTASPEPSFMSAAPPSNPGFVTGSPSGYALRNADPWSIVDKASTALDYYGGTATTLGYANITIPNFSTPVGVSIGWGAVSAVQYNKDKNRPELSPCQRFARAAIVGAQQGVAKPLGATVFCAGFAGGLFSFAGMPGAVAGCVLGFTTAYPTLGRAINAVDTAFFPWLGLGRYEP